MKKITQKQKFYSKIAFVYSFCLSAGGFFFVKEKILMFYQINEMLESSHFSEHVKIYKSDFFLPALILATLGLFLITLTFLLKATVNIKYRIHHWMELSFVCVGLVFIFLYPVYSTVFENYFSDKLESKGYFTCRKISLIFNRKRPIYWVRDKKVCEKYRKKVGREPPFQFIK